MNKFKIFEQNPSIAIIKLEKNVLGGNEALEFTSQLAEMPVHNIKRLIVDLSDVDAMNSSGLGMLVAGLGSLKRNNIEFVLTSPNEKILNLLAVTHLDKVFMIYNDLEKALAK